MKALVISDRQEIINFVTPLLKEKGFDLIHYKWIIKAMDNIEEIQPDAIIVSAEEYPRHWKTLAGFVQSGIGGNTVKVYLYDNKTLSVEDAVKADELGVTSFEKAFSEPVIQNNERSFTSVQIAYNESHGIINFCTGKYYTDENLIELEEKLTNGSYFKYISMFDGNNVISFSATAENNAEGNACFKVNEL